MTLEEIKRIELTVLKEVHDFCENNNLSSYYDSRFNDEGINEFANRLSKFKDIRLMFLDELGKIQWGENFS